MPLVHLDLAPAEEVGVPTHYCFECRYRPATHWVAYYDTEDPWPMCEDCARQHEGLTASVWLMGEVEPTDDRERSD